MKIKTILFTAITFFLFQNGFAQSTPSSDSIEIKITIPSVFSPDGHKPEKFCIQKLDTAQIVKFDMKIYNRWGQLYFESNDIKNCWDGRFKGEVCPMGVYVYKIEIDLYDQVAKKELNGYKYNGTVTLVR